MQLTRLLLRVALLALAGCTGATDLRDQLRHSDLRMSFAQRLRLEKSAPLIVLGRVVDVTQVGSPVPSRFDSRIKTQLDRVKVEVEEVLKGTAGLGALEFYYFAYSSASEIDLGVPRYLPQIGQRRLYFLKEDKGLYRPVGDVTDYTLRVSTGAHERGYCRGQSPGCCIAAILLAPGTDTDLDWFIVDLARSAYAAEVLCSRASARTLLNRLVEDPDKRIAGRARQVIAASSPIQ